jgi:hypothetical protein
MSGFEGVKEVQIAAPTPYPGQEFRFTGNLEWMRCENDGPQTITIFGHDGETLLHVLPGDIKPFHFGSREYSTLRIGTDIGLTGGDIALGNFLYLHYKLKMKGH